MIYLDRAIQKYRSDGLRSLFVDGASIVASPQLWCIRFVTTVGLCPVTRSELRKIAIHEYRIRDMESITIPPREEYPVEFARLTGKHILGEPFVAELTDAYLFGPHGICLTNDGRPILETVMARRDKLERKLLETPSATIRLALSRRFTEVTGTYDTVCSLANSHYPHWILNELPRLQGLELFEKKTGITPKIVIASDIKGYQRESLNLLGIPNERILEWTGKYDRVERLVVPTVRAPEVHSSEMTQRLKYDLSYKLTSPAALQWVRQRALDAVTLETESRRLFIARTDADRRRVVNRDELLDKLEKKGFETFVPGHHSIEEQVQTFATAEAIVAPHGGGLANLVFAPDAVVVELFGEKIKPTFFLLAQSLDVPYRHLICDPVDDDLRVDVDRVVSELEKLGVSD